MSSENFASVLYLALLLAALGGWALVEYRGRLGEMARVAAAWALIFLAVAAGYGLWGDLRTTIAPQQTASTDRVTIPRAEDGHYYFTLDIGGKPLTLMADTGASQIVLSQSDASALGIDLANLNYLGTAMTANGEVRTARAALGQIRLGPFVDEGISAFVSDGDMDGSLLGMSYLSRFNIALRDGKMELTRRN